MENYKKIIIVRNSSLYGCALSFNVELDGNPVGFLKNGGTVVAYTSEGPHTISFFKRKKLDSNFSVFVNSNSEDQTILVKLDAGQHIVPSDPEQLGLNGTSTDKQQNGKKKHPIRYTILGVAVFLILLVAIFGGSDKEHSFPLAEQGQTQLTELTDEEKAAQTLAEATEKFQSGDYISAIELCNSISSDYPNTEIASNISNYLDEQFSLFHHLSATDLMAEYDSNIVNADELYTGAIIVVSGTISSIGKTNNGSNLTVLLNSGTYFSGVQLNFKTSQTDAVAALSEGDNITAIGKCTGKSGTVLLVLEGNNVMIENCYLIG